MRNKLLLILLLIIVLISKNYIYDYLFENISYTNIITNYTDNRINSLEEKLKVYEEVYGFKDDYLDNYTYSKIITKDTYSLNNSILIYKGINSDIEINNLVVNEYGLVGIISKVNNNTSLVKLINSEDVNISVKINNLYGILKYKDNKFIIEGIEKSKINNEDLVYTSDISIYPDNVYIGSVEISDNTIYMNSKVDFNNIRYVLIIKGLRG